MTWQPDRVDERIARSMELRKKIEALATEYGDDIFTFWASQHDREGWPLRPIRKTSTLNFMLYGDTE